MFTTLKKTTKKQTNILSLNGKMHVADRIPELSVSSSNGDQHQYSPYCISGH